MKLQTRLHLYFSFVWLISLREQCQTKLIQKKSSTKLHTRFHWLGRLGFRLAIRCLLIFLVQSNLAIRNGLIRNLLVLSKEHFRATRKFLIAKFDCNWKEINTSRLKLNWKTVRLICKYIFLAKKKNRKMVKNWVSYLFSLYFDINISKWYHILLPCPISGKPVPLINV